MINSSVIEGVLRKAAAAIIGFMLAMVLLTALLIAGFVLLVRAAALALSPWVGEAGALGITGFSCFALLALFFYLMIRPVTRTARKKDADNTTKLGDDASPIEMLKNFIRKNPWEAVLAAFAIGVVENGDPRLRALLLQGGMAFMKQPDGNQPGHSADSDTASARPPEAADV